MIDGGQSFQRHTGKAQQGPGSTFLSGGCFIDKFQLPVAVDRYQRTGIDSHFDVTIGFGVAVADNKAGIDALFKPRLQLEFGYSIQSKSKL